MRKLSHRLHVLTKLAMLLPISLFAGTALADGPCPGSLAFYGESAGGFCCDGTTSNGYCSGSACALDPSRTQGLPVCYQENSTTCRDMGALNYYGGLVGGFCCDSALGADKNTCTGTICALDPMRSQGYPVCTPMTAECPWGQDRYGEWAGGFCCDGTVAAGAGSCDGTVCALDPERTQGLPLCPVMPTCPAGQGRYGEWAGGFCCDGTVGPGGGSCYGDICSLDPTRTQGYPLCYAPTAQGTEDGVHFFTSSPGGGLPFRFFTAGEINSTPNGVSISGDITVEGLEGAPGITLADAVIELEFDSSGYVSAVTGEAHVSLPSTGASGLEIDDLGVVEVGLAWGADLKDPQNSIHLDAPMQDERQYLFFHIAGGLAGSFGPVGISAPGGGETLLVIDPRDPSVYFHGDLSGLTGLSALDDVGIGASVQGLLPFHHESTWGVQSFAQDFNGHFVIEAPIPLPQAWPLSAEGQLMVRLPTSADPFTRIGMNSTLSVGVEFVPNVADFSFELANATVGGSFNASPASGEVYFSAHASSQGFIDSLPDLSVMPSIGANVGVHVAGRLSTNPADHFLRVAGNGSFNGQEVVGLDMRYAPTGVWASGRFRLGSGFWANMSGTVGPTSAQLSGEGYVEIPIYGAKQIVSGTYQAINYTKNAAECGSTTAANAAECGWATFTDHFCRTFPWLCSAPPATCTFANSCTKDVWVQQTIHEPNFNYGAFTAKAQIHATTPSSVTVNFTNIGCPPYVGSCSVGAEDLNTTQPKVCVTSSTFGKFCEPMNINSAATN